MKLTTNIISGIELEFWPSDERNVIFMKEKILRKGAGLLLGLLLFGIAGCSQPAQPPQETKPVQKPEVKLETGVTTEKIMPAISLPSLDGKKVNVEANGKPMIINFWATWCPPCRAEMPELDRFAADHRQDVSFWAVNIQEPEEKVQEFLQQHQYSLPVLMDVSGDVAKTFRISAIPTTLVVDGKGVIRLRKSGTISREELEGALKNLTR